MPERFQKAIKNTAFQSLNEEAKEFVKTKSLALALTFSQIQIFITVAIDFQMWGLNIKDIWQEKNRDESFKSLLERYNELKNLPKSYKKQNCKKQKQKNVSFYELKTSIGFGKCPVASDKTMCCNLLTLDVYEGCGFGCSYCSIQTFYGGGNIKTDKDFAKKLLNLKLKPDKIYHIGTGQSSDSLLFGDKNGTLDALIRFAEQNQNVILEFKSKSSNIKHLLNSKIPQNIICTFSLNPQSVIDNEEHFTASLNERVKAAEMLAKTGVLVGFHFHPMIFFENWEEEYTKIAQKLIQKFSPNSVALVSFGTLTFIKPVLKKIREKALQTKILQMPLCETHGKYSYPKEIKEIMFKTLYSAFEAWKDKVFFYLCMEDKNLWHKTFGYSYANNTEFEEAMKKAYKEKIAAMSKFC